MNAERAIELLTQMRENCAPKENDVYNDPLRKEKRDALSMAIAQLSDYTGTHARWEYVGGNKYAKYHRCANCSAVYDFTPPYCPNCGAKMDA